MKTELLKANRSELDDLPRPEYSWEWSDVVGEDGLCPSVAERLLQAGYLIKDSDTGMWSVDERLWSYIDDAGWLDVDGRDAGQTPLEMHGVDVPRDRSSRPRCTDGGEQAARLEDRSRQVALDMQSDVEDDVVEIRERETGRLQKIEAAKLAVESQPQWQAAREDSRQTRLGTRVVVTGRLSIPSESVY